MNLDELDFDIRKYTFDELKEITSDYEQRGFSQEFVQRENIQRKKEETSRPWYIRTPSGKGYTFEGALTLASDPKCPFAKEAREAIRYINSIRAQQKKANQADLPRNGNNHT